MALTKQMLAWCPTDNIGVRFLLGDIALLQGGRYFVHALPIDSQVRLQGRDRVDRFLFQGE